MLGARRAAFTRTLRRGDSGEDVRQLQELLLTVGHHPGPADGVFGSRTHAAVVAFQRSQRLDPDGAVGPLTRAALAAAAASGAPASGGGGRTALSLHVGLNVVDDGAYGFAVPPLAGCVNDANDMQALAQSRGFRARLLINSQGTAAAVVSGIREAARSLRSGDIFWLSYSGHGSQVPDPREPDASSETWVLYDRQLIDDELYALWSEFQPGVRVLVISDSCHSGTVTRELMRLNTEIASSTTRAREGAGPEPPAPAVTLDLGLELVSATAGLLERAGHSAPGAAAKVVRQALAPMTPGNGRSRDLEIVERARLVVPADAAGDAARRGDLYRNAVAAAAGAPEPQCKTLLIAACQDNQTASDGRPDPTGHQNGAFTRLLRQEWAAARDYADLHARVVSQMPATQTPNLFWATPRDLAFEAQAPFTV